jgi:hypothetical protein
MVAQVFSLFANKSKFAASLDWSSQELAEFYRVEASLIQSGIRVAGDRGLTDEGDPWFVFCRPTDGEVIIHFARIAGVYIIVSETLGQTLRGLDFRKLLSDFSSINPTLVPLRKAEASANLFIHPAALLAAVVAAAFLHFSGSEAVASEILSDSYEHLTSAHLVSQSQNEKPAFYSIEVLSATERRETDRLVIAAMAAMIGLVSRESGSLDQDHLLNSLDKFLDTPLETFQTSQTEINHDKLSSGNEFVVYVKSNDMFSLHFREQPIFASLGENGILGPVVNSILLGENRGILDSSAQQLVQSQNARVIDWHDHSDTVSHAGASSEAFLIIPPVMTFAKIKSGSGSFPGADDNLAHLEAASNISSGSLDHPSIQTISSQPYLQTAMQIVNTDVVEANRSIIIVVLNPELNHSDILDYATIHALGINFTSAIHVAEINPAGVGGEVDGPVSNFVKPASSSGVNNDDLSFGNNSVAVSYVRSNVSAVISAQPARAEFAAFNANAERLLRSFITENQTEIFTTGRDVVVVDVDTHHAGNNDLFIKSWSAYDGSTISVIGHSSHADSGLLL